MKLYMVFAGEKYYPIGGFEDFIAEFDSLQEAMDWVEDCSVGWAHIAFIGENRRIVARKTWDTNPNTGKRESKGWDIESAWEKGTSLA